MLQGRLCRAFLLTRSGNIPLGRLQHAQHCSRKTVHVSPVCMGRRSSKIATRKNAQDAMKAKVFGKTGKLIIAAVRTGGPDVTANVRLKDILDQARAAGVPKDIVERNIKKASDKSQEDFAEVVYEAYGPGGTGFVIECLSDNVNRSAMLVRTAVTKAGGKMADPGSVLFNFRRQGVVCLGSTADEDEAFEAAMDAGAEDIQAGVAHEDSEASGPRVLTAVEDYISVRRTLEDKGLPVDLTASGLKYVPLAPAELDDDAVYDQNDAMFQRLLDVDDVDAVHTTVVGLQS